MKTVKKILPLFFVIILCCSALTLSASAASKDWKKTVTVGEKYQLTIYTGKNQKPVNGTKVTWKSSNTKIVKVDKTGVATTLKAGTATVTGKYKGETCSFKFTVKNATLKYKTKTSTTGASFTQTLKDASGKTVKNENIKWTTSDSDIATVNSEGKVQTKKAGTVTISAKYLGKTYKCTVTIKNATLKYTKKTLYTGDSFTQVIKNAGGNELENTKAKWLSSDTEVATVSSSGKIKAIAPGKATITAKYLGKSYKCTVTVNQSVMTVDKTSISLKPSKVYTVNCTLTEIGEIKYSNSDTSIIECYWDTSFDGDNIKLFVKALNPGKAKITITNTVNSQKKTIEVTVGSDVKVKLPSVPKTLKKYNSADKVESSLSVTDIDYKLYYDESTGKYNIWLEFDGKREKTGGKKGTSLSCYIGIKIYDSEGNVVDSETLYTPALDIGEKFKNLGYTFYGFQKGTYTVKLYNVG